MNIQLINHRLCHFVLSAIAIALSACATTDQTGSTNTSTVEAGSVAAMPPMPKVGVEYHWISDGEASVGKVISVEDEALTVQFNNNCQIKAGAWDYGPMLKLEGCGGASRTHTVRKSKGSPWPMAIGNNWSHTYAGISENGVPYRGKYRCNVDGVENITVAVGEFSTYKIICKDGQITSTYWYTPDYPVRGVLHTVDGPNVHSRSELVKVVTTQ